jgi:hypothetical protein
MTSKQIEPRRPRPKPPSLDRKKQFTKEMMLLLNALHRVSDDQARKIAKEIVKVLNKYDVLDR